MRRFEILIWSCWMIMMMMMTKSVLDIWCISERTWTSGSSMALNFFVEMEGWTFGPPSAIVGTDLSQFFAWDVHILTHMSRHVSALVCLCPLRLILGTPECRRCPMAPNSFCHISIKTFSTFPHGLPAHPFVICICLIWYSPGQTVKSQQLCRILLLCMCPS